MPGLENSPVMVGSLGQLDFHAEQVTFLNLTFPMGKSPGTSSSNKIVN